MDAKRGRRQRAGLGSAVAVVAVAALTAPVLASDATVIVRDLAFAPASVTIDVGDLVTWRNDDATGHSATGNTGVFDTGTISPGEAVSITFESIGTFAYHCAIHPAMTGRVVVKGVLPSSAASGLPTATSAPAAPVASQAADTTGSGDEPAATNPATDAADGDSGGTTNILGLLGAFLALVATAVVAFARPVKPRPR